MYSVVFDSNEVYISIRSKFKYYWKLQITILLIILMPILICTSLKLDNIINIELWKIMSPIIIYQALFGIWLAIKGIRSYTPHKIKYALSISESILLSVILFLSLLTLKVDNIIDVDWYYVFLPIFLVLLYLTSLFWILAEFSYALTFSIFFILVTIMMLFFALKLENVINGDFAYFMIPYYILTFIFPTCVFIVILYVISQVDDD